MINEQLKLVRKVNNFTQQQVADALGIDRSTYASYETGRNRPDIKFVSAFAKTFGITIDFILNLDPNCDVSVYDTALSLKKGKKEKLLSLLRNDEKELIAMYRISSSEAKEQAWEILKQSKEEVINSL